MLLLLIQQSSDLRSVSWGGGSTRGRDFSTSGWIASERVKTRFYGLFYRRAEK